MTPDPEEPYRGSSESYLASKYPAAEGYLMVNARVMLVGFEPRYATSYVCVDFVPPPPGCPLGVSTMWADRGVELAKFAMAHGKRLCIVYRPTGFRWSDVVDISVLDY